MQTMPTLTVPRPKQPHIHTMSLDAAEARVRLYWARPRGSTLGEAAMFARAWEDVRDGLHPTLFARLLHRLGGVENRGESALIALNETIDRRSNAARRRRADHKHMVQDAAGDWVAIPDNMGLIIRDARERRGMTARTLAGRIKLNESYLAKIELGRKPVTAAVLRAVESVLGPLMPARGVQAL